jgi:hypothetical protein
MQMHPIGHLAGPRFYVHTNYQHTASNLELEDSNGMHPM